MRFSLSWLRSFTPVPDLPVQEIAEAITRHVVEVEDVLSTAPAFRGVVVGRILEVRPHPNADKLQCTVTTTDGTNRLAIVCGARNIAPGQVVPVALPGASVLDRKTGERFTIRDAVIRGQPSQGMLCSADELGIPSAEEGIHQLPTTTEIGADLAATLGLGDSTFDVKGVALTNRPDLWGHWGMARELAVLFQTPLALPRIVHPRADPGVPVTVDAATEARRYVALSITGVAATGSPAWLQQRLEQLGVRSVNAIVDVTNLVMLETGQPLHAFDARTVRDVTVRCAAPGERLTTFDGTALELTPEDVVIATAERALALAGVVGSPESGVQLATDAIVLESASFDPVRTRRTASRHSVRTDAAVRFEKDLDPNLAPLAAARALQLFQELFPQARLVGRTDVERHPRAPGKIQTSMTELSEILGAPIVRTDVTRILSGLGFAVRGRADAVEVVVPTSRGGADVATPADLVEELGRFIGYDALPAARLPMPLTLLDRRDALRQRLARELLARATSTLAATEVHTAPLTNAEELRRFRLSTEAHLHLRNPQTIEATHARTTLLPGLATAAWRNVRVAPDALLVELGPVFHADRGVLPRELTGDAVLPHQPQRLGLLASGGDGSAALSRLRGALDVLLVSCGLPRTSIEADRDPATPFHPGRSGTVRCAGIVVGIIGELHPEVRVTLDGLRVAYAELDLESLVAVALEHPPAYGPPPPFPGSTKDVSVAVPEELPVGTLLAAVERAAVEYLTSIEAIDVFRGAGLPAGSKSVTLRLELRAADHTLSEGEIEAAVQAASSALVALGATVR